MARNWREVRAEAVAAGKLDPVEVEKISKKMAEMERTYRLAEVRKALGMTRQSDIAERMGVSQARVSKLERGDLAHTELGTLQAYVAALGGELHVTVQLGDDRIELSA